MAPNLAERLAIHGCCYGKDDDNDNEEYEEMNGKKCKGCVTTIGGTYIPLLPSPSEDSSTKTVFSIGGVTGTIVTNAVITGGPICKQTFLGIVMVLIIYTTAAAYTYISLLHETTLLI
eukprot:10643025-Ditylum_brightwellii.AAC.2